MYGLGIGRVGLDTGIWLIAQCLLTGYSKRRNGCYKSILNYNKQLYNITGAGLV
jgi:hypothetical protein